MTAERLPSSPLRVALFDAYADVVGGAHAIWREISDAGQNSGLWEATVVLPGEGVAASWLRRSGVRVSVVPAPRALLLFGGSWRREVPALLLALPRFWWRLRRELTCFDIVHLSDLRGLVLAGPSVLFTRTRRIVHIHSGDSGGVLWRLMAAVLLRTGAAVLVPSRAGAQDWAGRAAGRLIELPNPVPELGLRVEGPSPLIVCVARLHPQKGLDVLLDAVELLAGRGLAPRTLIVGPDSPGLEGVVAGLRARSDDLSNVEFTGPLEDVSQALGSAWIYVQPSRQESFGLAALEASASGLPVIATRTGGLRDVVVDGVTGILVTMDDPHELAAAMELLLGSREARERMGSAGRARAQEHFSRSEFAERLQTLYALERSEAP